MINTLAAVFIAASNLTAPSGYGWVCPILDKNPNLDGVSLVVIKAFDTGASSDAAADGIVGEVANNCPEYLPLLQKWAKQHG